MQRPLHSILVTSVFLCIAFLHSPRVHAKEAVVIKDIKIEGLKRLTPETLLSDLPLKKGDTLTGDATSKSIQSMYDTGLIADATVGIDGGVAIFHVVERPVVAELDFSGLHEFDKDMLARMFHNIGVKKDRPLDKSLLEKASQALKQNYFARGFLTAKVQTTTTPIDGDRVSLLVSVIEGPIAKIQQVDFIGNKDVPDSTLREEITLHPSDWLSWHTKNDVFSQERLLADMDRLRNFYLNRGYVEFSITSLQASLTPDGKGIDLAIGLHEGAPHTIEGVKLSGDLLGREQELESLIGIRPQETYSADKIDAARTAIVQRLGQYGYGLADVQVVSRTDQDRHTVDLTLQVNPGHRLYVRRVSIEGNTRTRDEVIRREMRQLESAWYDARQLADSRDRINRLDFFSTVEVTLMPVEGSADQTDIIVRVVEKKTGAISLSAGSSSSDVLFVSAGISEKNVLGSGNGLAVQLDTSKANRRLSVQEYTPYVTQDGISRSSDIYYKTTQLKGKNDKSDVKITSLGGGIAFGIPVTDNSKVILGAAFERNRYSINEDSPKVYKDHVKQFGDVVNNLPLSVEWKCDTRDSNVAPSRGYVLHANAELGTPLGDTSYYKGDLRGAYYYAFAKGFVLSARIEVGYGQGFLGTPYPITKHYYAGGIGSVRGYKEGSLGPKDTVTGDSIGGSKTIVGSLEMTLPLPGSGWDKKLRVFSFLDGGNVWGDQGSTSGANGLRYSYGAGLEWLSPIGPLKLSLGIPLGQCDGDDLQRLQFQIGTSF